MDVPEPRPFQDQPLAVAGFLQLSGVRARRELQQFDVGLEGRVCDRVYDTGRDLLDAGVVEAEDTLPGTATVKLMWVLANVEPESVPETMRRSLAGEVTRRSTPRQ